MTGKLSAPRLAITPAANPASYDRTGVRPKTVVRTHCYYPGQTLAITCRPCDVGLELYTLSRQQTLKAGLFN